MPRQDSKVVIVTGGSRGIRYEAVRLLVALGAHVIIGGKDKQEGRAAVQKILAEYRWAKVEFLKLDLASLQSIRDFVVSFKERKLPLNILLNNAGVTLVPESRTADGFEQHFGVNYLGHFLLTWLLLDTLKDCGKCAFFSRVVSVPSSAHHIGEIRLNERNICQYYSALAAYRNNKLAQLLCSSYLHQELQKEGSSVSSCAVDPGMVDTALHRHLWTGLWLPQRKIAYLLFRSPAEGAAPVLYAAHAALSPAPEGECGGGYWASGRRETTAPPTHDPQLQHSLWESSLRWLGLQ